MGKTVAMWLYFKGGKVMGGGLTFFAFGNGVEVDFDFGLGEDVGGGGHVDKEIYVENVHVSRNPK